MGRPKTIEAAHGRWREILPILGVPATALSGKHVPCPSCGGTDRVRFHDRHGDGDYFCSHCGAGKGISLVAKVNGLDYAEAASRIDDVIGNLPDNVKAAKVKARAKPDGSTASRKLWAQSLAVTEGDPVERYLTSRGICGAISEALRYVPDLYHAPTGSTHPGMIARISDVGGQSVMLHRTYLTHDGKKSHVEPSRMLMPRDFPVGGAIRLFAPAETLGVAEGIETALAASELHNIPVWSTIAEGFLQTWQPPNETNHVVIFGDNDENFVGQNAAYALARRLARDRPDMKVEVLIPQDAGSDWNDVGTLSDNAVRGFIRASWTVTTK